MNLIFFGIYALAVILLFVFIAIFLLNIREYREYSRYINPVLRIYLILIIIISIYGGYKVLTGTTLPIKSPETQNTKLNF
jgi:NADH:ubiquinone oxidoreductase subunit 6 (subunit J)